MCIRDRLRLLPAGAVAGWGLHPLESAAFSRRTPEADIPPLHSITTSARSSFVLALMIGDDSIKMVSSLRWVKRSLSFQKGSVSVVTSGSPLSLIHISEPTRPY